MGWTSTYARFYTESGKVDRKAECDDLFTWENEKIKVEVLKSAMKGAIYYAAVRTTDKTSGKFDVWAAVCITSTKKDGWFNFGYKSMSEDSGPCYCNCPKSILVLLTDTDNEYAKEWRAKCWANIQAPQKSLASVKIGEIIEFEYGGETIRAEKMAPAYQFKTPWFKRVDKDFYIKKNHIKDWTLVCPETEAQQAATPTETPQISTETAETVNVSDEGEKREETAKYRIFRYRSDNFEKVTIGDKSQCRVICILSTFKGKSYIEIGNTTIGVGTGGQQLIEVSRSITDMSDAELIDIMLNTKVSHNIYEDKIYPYSYFVNEDTPQPPENAPQSPQSVPNNQLCHPDTESAGNRKKTAKFSISAFPNNSPLYVTQYITPRNVCSTRMFHGKLAACW